MGQRLSWLFLLTGLLGVWTQDYTEERTGERRTRVNGQTSNFLKYNGGKTYDKCIHMLSSVWYGSRFNDSVPFRVSTEIH